MYKTLSRMMSAAMVIVLACSTTAFGAEVTPEEFSPVVPVNEEVQKEADITEANLEPVPATENTQPQGKKLVPRELDAKAQPTLFTAAPKPEPPKPVVKKEKQYDFDIASYTTKYSGADSLNRNYNMRLASDSINGMILQPGQTFSYNDVILSKSNNGKLYKEAGIYVNGEVSTGIGGGICQISSTLYQAALYSGMQITQRQNHSLRVGYMPAGRDATASWGSIDFKFKNPLSIPVKIESVMKNGTIKIRFLAQQDPKIGEIKVDVTQKDGVYTLTRTRADGTIDHTSRSKYKN